MKTTSESELELWKSLVDSIPLRVYAKDVDNDCRYALCNKYYADHLEMLPEDVVGKFPAELHPPVVAKMSERITRETIASDGMTVTEDIDIDVNGARMDLRTTETLRTLPDGRRFVFGFCTDITQDNMTLRLEQTINEIASLPIEGVDFLSNAFEVLARKDRMDVLQLKWVTRAGREDRSIWPQEIKSEPIGWPEESIAKKVWTDHYDQIKKDGLAVYEDLVEAFPELDTLFQAQKCRSVAVLPIKSRSAGEVGEVVLIFRTRQNFTPRYRGLLKLLARTLSISRTRIHARAELRAQLARSEEAERAKSYFFASVSHDIRTPLNSIIGFSELMKASNLEETLRRQYVDAIASSGQVLLRLVNDVLDLAKLEAGQMKFYSSVTDFSRIVHELSLALLPQAQSKGLVIKSEIEPNFPYVEIDRQRVRQILFNLMGNAVKFTDKGFIKVAAEFRPDKEGQPFGKFRFGVIDTGRGISEEDLGRLMKPFVQLMRTDQGHGTGLGLAICRQMSEKMGGTLTIESKVGVGSAFVVTLPNIPYTRVAPENWNLSQTQRIKLVTDPRSYARLRFLVVDDMDLNLLVIKNMLARLGVKNIVTAHSGVEALAELEKDGGQPFDAVLTDMWMPEMGGGELVGCIRRDSRFFTMPVYAITADVEIVKTYQELGFTGLLLKPVTLNLLTEFLDNFSKTNW